MLLALLISTVGREQRLVSKSNLVAFNRTVVIWFDAVCAICDEQTLICDIYLRTEGGRQWLVISISVRIFKLVLNARTEK